MRLLASALFFSLGLVLGTLVSDLGSSSHQAAMDEGARVTANQASPAPAPLERASLAPASRSAEPPMAGERCDAGGTTCAADIQHTMRS